MVSVPAILDKICRRINRKIQHSNFVKKALLEFALSYKRKWLYRGANTPITNALLMETIKYTLGMRSLKSVMSGGAPLNPITQEFLRLTLCCPIVQGYGLTETCSAGTITDADDLSSGHVGGPLACTLVKLVDWEEGGYTISDVPSPRGEIWIGGPTVAIGYHKNSERSDEEFQQRGNTRWFATGDIGKMRADGTIVIIDRKKDIIKLQNGEYVSLGAYCNVE